MWTKHELEDLSETFRDIKLEEIVDEDELAVIKENSTRYFNLKNGLVVPCSHIREHACHMMLT